MGQPKPEIRPPDEDTFVIPDSWRGKIHLGRGGSAVGRGPKVSTKAAARLREHVDTVKYALKRSAGDSTLIEDARAYLRGEANPVGAAVVASLLAVRGGNVPRKELVALADAWTSEHGIVFAAEATAELGRVGAVEDMGGFPKTYYQVGVVREEVWYELFDYKREDILHRMRALLAVADEQDYRAAVAALASRRDCDGIRVAAAYLAPTETDWADEVLGMPMPGMSLPPLVFTLARSVDQLEWLRARRWDVLFFPETLYTVTERIGPAIAPLVADLLDNTDYDGQRQTLAGVLGALPTDEAFDLLVARLDQPQIGIAMAEAISRYPMRAFRLLAAAASGATAIAPVAAQLLSEHASANPELTATVLPTLPPESRATLESVDQAADVVEVAPADALPSLLVEPPWTRKRKAGKPVVKGLVAEIEPAIVWADGERQKWASAQTSSSRNVSVDIGPLRVDIPPDQADAHWVRQVQAFRDGELRASKQKALFLNGPEDLVRPLLADWQPETDQNADTWLKVLVARFELDALPAVLSMIRRARRYYAELMLPLFSSEITEIMAELLVEWADWLDPDAEAWFHRHATAAARALVPAALGKAGEQRRYAERALRFIAHIDSNDGVVEAARGYGDKAASALQSWLDQQRPFDLPARMPEVGFWLDLHQLPRVLLRDRRQALPISAVEHIVTMLTLSWTNGKYSGVDVVREICDPASLAEFGWAVFQQSREAPWFTGTKKDWAFPALGLIGDDDTVRRVTPLIRTLSAERKHGMAATGLDVLVAIGTDTALIHLNSIAQNAKSKGLRTKAEEKIAELAANIGLSQEQLADRLVPDFGLAADGSLTLDYGPRRFTVGFDEHLQPFVANEAGERLKALPKPGARDDQELAPAAYKRFTALKKDVRTIATAQIRRFEQAMVAQRRWTAAEFHDLFVNHPLLWHVARRLVWTTDDGSATFPDDEFRIAEDRTLADANDTTLTLSESATVAIAHPVHLGDTVSAWAEIFADYEMQQPFPQLDRPVHVLTEDEAASTELKRFHDRIAATGTVLGLERRGWERTADKNTGTQSWIARPAHGNRCVVVNLDPGIHLATLDTCPEQRITTVWINGRPGGDSAPRPLIRFGELDPVIASEVIADLTTLTNA